MATIAHLSADFPDPVVEGKTRAIRTIVELVDDRFDQSIISINRRAPGFAELARSLLGGGLPIETLAFPAGVAMTYAAPGKGILHRVMLEKLGDAICARLAGERTPDLLVGHKLTVEGFPVARAASRLGKPYALTIQGDTDCKILALRPDLQPALKRIFHGAAMVTSFAPWSLEAVESKLGKRQGPTFVIPCPTELDRPLAPDPSGSGLLTVFHLKSQRRKNLATMARAMDMLADRGEAQELAVVGGGSPKDMEVARKVASRAEHIFFEGPSDRAAIQARMNRAAAFVLPSRRESFGLVFVEALFAGCPIIYPRGRAVDGYFDGMPFAVAVDPGDPAALADAICELTRCQAEAKAALAEWQASDHARRFTRPAIAEDYGKALEQALRFAD
ncbi:glycosyltransferase family 4 protein [Alteraurantiacibacter aquimixticola]|uniref:Glycosyltransferase n=1 Tax=Alteraurantiacibacter aquimixticola TaxID=2489173 RepID=A0A4T3F0V4_9SPHN|nr:glycosyltransferase family 4 protein [Alteraurantiacibacter aquimixticola]TIX48982.1 glycosyltransferase [Alteraurantiacibacter aquimixticola]